MGTSKGYGGPGSGLVPSFLDEPNAAGNPAALPFQSDAPLDSNPDASSGGAADDGSKEEQSNAPVPAPSRIAVAGSFTNARSNFTRFAKSGERRALGRALSSYVRKGAGGSSNAARRMGAARATGSRLLGLISDARSVGVVRALARRLDVPGLAGRPAADVLIQLIEYVCPPGGSIDEAIARQAMLDAIGDMASAGLGDIEQFTAEQLQELFIDFVSRSIESRVMADIGGQAIRLPQDAEAVARAQEQLHDFVHGCTRGALSGRLDGVADLDGGDLDSLMSALYAAAFDLLAAIGENQE